DPYCRRGVAIAQNAFRKPDSFNSDCFQLYTWALNDHAGGNRAVVQGIDEDKTSRGSIMAIRIEVQWLRSFDGDAADVIHLQHSCLSLAKRIHIYAVANRGHCCAHCPGGVLQEKFPSRPHRLRMHPDQVSLYA